MRWLEHSGEKGKSLEERPRRCGSHPGKSSASALSEILVIKTNIPLPSFLFQILTSQMTETVRGAHSCHTPESIILLGCSYVLISGTHVKAEKTLLEVGTDI